MERVAELELKLEEQCSVAHIRGLMELYSGGIEYFESVSDSAYKEYQARLQALLSRQDVQNVLSKPAEVRRPPLSKLSSRPPRGLVTSTSAVTLPEKRSVEKFLDHQLQKASEVKRTIQENLKSQKETFEHRLRERQSSCGRTRQASPMTSPKAASRHLLTSEYDKSGGPSKSALSTYEYERELERIMEDHVNSKLAATQQIETCYDSQMSELASLPKNETITKLMAAMQKRKQSDIELAFRELETKKTQRVKALKQRLLV